jgi:hypothetical protein
MTTSASIIIQNVNTCINHQERGRDSLAWIIVVQDRDNWQALVKRVMNLKVHTMRGMCWLDEALLS